MIRRPPRSTQSRSSAASDVYKRQGIARSDALQMMAFPVTVVAAKSNLEMAEAVAREIRSLSPVLIVAGMPSVSYTHLRAHETVLDLVCRLLLEKKKKNKEKKIITNEQQETERH